MGDLKKAWSKRKSGREVLTILLAALPLAVLLSALILIPWFRNAAPQDERSRVAGPIREGEELIENYYTSAMDTIKQLPFKEYATKIKSNFLMNAYHVRMRLSRQEGDEQDRTTVTQYLTAFTENKNYDIQQFYDQMPSVASLPESERMDHYIRLSNIFYYKSYLQTLTQGK